MREQKQIGLVVSLLCAQTIFISGASAADGASAPLIVAPTSLTDVHAGGIAVSQPSLIVPGGGDASTQPLIIPGGMTPKGAAIPAINPLSLSPGTIATSAANKPNASFLSPESETEMSIKFGTLHLMPGSLVLLVSSDDTVSVYDLHDGKDKDVFVEVDNHKFALTPGKQVTIASSQYTDFGAANRLPFVLYATAEYQRINEGLGCFQGTYDINSLIFKFAPFRALLSSKNPKMRHVADQTLKTSAVMNQMTATFRYQRGQGTAGQTTPTASPNQITPNQASSSQAAIGK